MRFEWNALEGLRGLEKVKNVIIDQDLARWISYHPIYQQDREDDPEDDPQPIGFKFYYPDHRSSSFKFFLFNGIHPESLTVLFTRLLQNPDSTISFYDTILRYNELSEEPDSDVFAAVRVDFNFFNDDMDEVKQKLIRLGSLWVQSRQQNPTGRYVDDIDCFLDGTRITPGPVFRKGASCEEDGGFVDVTWVTFFSQLEYNMIPFPSFELYSAF